MLPKTDPNRRGPEVVIRAFEYCPDCGKYISPGFRTDCCPFCWADFTGTKEFKERQKSDKEFSKGMAIGRIKRLKAEYNLTEEDLK